MSPDAYLFCESGFRPVASVAGREATSGWLLYFQGCVLRINVYVDGFNLYYGALKKTSYRWLNLNALFAALLPRNKVQEIKYFSALVSDGHDQVLRSCLEGTVFLLLLQCS